MRFSGVNKEISIKKRRTFAKNALIEYLCNPDNPVPKNRAQYAKILGINITALRHLFSIDDFVEIECLALERRRQVYALNLARVDEALFDKAESGDVSGIKLVYQRFEGWGEKTITEGNNTLTLTLDPELKAMIEAGRRGAIPIECEATDVPVCEADTGS